MAQEIKSIEYPMRLAGISLGTANCYLIKSNTVYLLIDTGFPSKRAELEKDLERTGCHPGNLKLIVITHADLDHIGNCAYLREKYGAKIVMHSYEVGAAENGDASLSRKRRPFLERLIGGLILHTLARLAGFGRAEPFSPDLTVDDGDDLSGYGFDAKVVHLPGHSRGSIGIVTIAGDLFCGDLFWNMSRPGPHSIIDDSAAWRASVERLKGMNIHTVYPGHGKPFALDALETQ